MKRKRDSKGRGNLTIKFSNVENIDFLPVSHHFVHNQPSREFGNGWWSSAGRFSEISTSIDLGEGQ